MKRKESVTAFYLETLLLIVVFIAIILVLTQVFGLGRVQSAQARQLTNAVCLAQNAAEAVAASESQEAVAALLNESGNARVTPSGVEAGYNLDMSPNATRAPAFWVRIGWDRENGLVRSAITVSLGNEPEPIYRLDTAVYRGEVGA